MATATLTKRYARQDAYDAQIAAASAAHRVPVPVIKAIIAHESRFDERAYNDEGGRRGGSRGLMQMSDATARLLGYTGAPDGVYDVPTNLELGARYIADNISYAASNGYGLDSALSMYNGGPSTERPGDGKRTGNSHTAADRATPFVNQAYVDSVMEKVRYFERYESLKSGDRVSLLGIVADNALTMLMSGGLLYLFSRGAR
jgi:soluble lytic murein transglycosylase-like protein